jgi:hypothetical protein
MLVAALVTLVPLPILAAQQYRVELVRAAPGSLLEVIDLYRLQASVSVAAGEEPPLMMRHSQGDQWDLMILSPVPPLAKYFSPEQAEQWDRAARGAGAASRREFEAQLRAHIAWREELFASGPPHEELSKRRDSAAFFHIEMFRSLPGKHAALLEQREMENAYLRASGRPDNLVFARVAGAGWDAFTIGFYRDLRHFAEDSDLSDDALEEAARRAGFEARNRIGTYLRTLIDSHHDTLATLVRGR